MLCIQMHPTAQGIKPIRRIGVLHTSSNWDQGRRCKCHSSIGIDLGTTTSAACVIQDSKAQVIPLDEGGSLLLPSTVYFRESDGPLVGASAACSSAGVLVDNVKRLMGRQFSETAVLQRQISYNVAAAPDGSIDITWPDGRCIGTPEDVSCQILKKLKSQAEKYLGKPVDSVVVTVPSHFRMQQRMATMNAATAAGLERVSLLQEPIAAALAHGLGRKSAEEPAILVVDIGGGTCDVSLVQSFEGMLEVNGYDGDSCLGGADLDFYIVQYWVQIGRLPGETLESISKDKARLSAIRKEATRCKIELSSVTTCTVMLDSSAVRAGTQTFMMTREDLAAAAQPFLKRLWIPLSRLAESHHLQFAHYPEPSQQPTEWNRAEPFAPPPRVVSKLLLVGGATQSHVISSFVEKIVGLKRCALSVEQEHCVAAGAALYASTVYGTEHIGMEICDGESKHGGILQAGAI